MDTLHWWEIIIFGVFLGLFFWGWNLLGHWIGFLH
jgi:hypothetical protein